MFNATHLDELDEKHERRRYRQRIKERDGHRCVYCGEPGGTLDHIQPRAKGGQTTTSNLAVACNGCNLRKGDQEVWEWYSRQPFYDSDRWQRIKEITGYEHSNQTH